MTTGHRSRLPSIVMATAAGALFGGGLVISGMTQPARVLGFLTATSAWDPSLAFVMAGAVATYAILYRWVRARRAVPWFDAAFHVPRRRDIDAPLIGGAAVFGVGWGLAGLCPGPSVVSLGGGSPAVIAFVAAMLVGMAAQRRLIGRHGNGRPTD